jgi:outer membrane biosynthesis protein TonB
VATVVVADPLLFDDEADLAIDRQPAAVAAPIAAPAQPAAPFLRSDPSYPKVADLQRAASHSELVAMRSDASEAKVVAAPTLAESSGPTGDGEHAGAHPVLGNPLREAVVGFAKNKRNIAIAAAGVMVLIVLIVVATGGDDKKPTGKREPVVAKRSAAKPAPVETPPAPSEPAPDPEPATEPAVRPEAHSVSTTAGATEPPVAPVPLREPPPAAAPEPAPPKPPPTATPAPPKKKKAPTMAGKQIVLEYDSAKETKAVPIAPNVDQAAVAKARTSYAAGNTRLFAGDADGAIRNYKQALAYYPGYVGAYRGLGLAYSQKGDKQAALKALRSYVVTVPTAKDAELIRKRIMMLSK